MIGTHFLKGWSRTQNHITMSSAEAELIALVKCSAELLGLRSMARDWGLELAGTVYADSTAALAIANRKGAGKLRHIRISSLWIQDKQDRGDIEYQKVLGTENPADLTTKYLIREKMDGLMANMSQVRLEGRAVSGLEIQGAPTPARTPAERSQEESQ